MWTEGSTYLLHVRNNDILELVAQEFLEIVSLGGGTNSAADGVTAFNVGLDDMDGEEAGGTSNKDFGRGRDGRHDMRAK